MEQNLFTYNRALELLFDRFPAIGFMVGSSEEVHPIDESLPDIAFHKAEVLYFYGLGKGAIYKKCQDWLEKDKRRKLIVLENDLGVIASFLHETVAIELLNNPQVYLEYFSNTDKEIEILTNRFTVKRVEVSGLGSKNDLKELRLKILRKTALSHALHLDRLHGYQPFLNFCENLKQIPNSFYANRLLGAFKNVPAVICGAGPSLSETIETLRGLEDKALIIAGGSTLAALSSEGVLPHLGMAIDPNVEEYRRLKNSFAFEVPLLYSTRVHPGIFQTCNGPFGYMRSGIGGLIELWLEEELGLLDPLIGKNLSPETISVTGICIALAVEMGCNPILINGVDLAYTGGKHYASGVTQDEEVELKKIDAEKSAADQILKRRDRKGNTIYTAVRWVMEAASISHYAKSHPEIQFINTTSGGIGFEGVEYVPIEKAVQGFIKQSIREKVLKVTSSATIHKDSKAIIERNFKELKESLSRSIEYLRILAKEKKGSTALAEMDLKEEIACTVLFYDIQQVLTPGENFWQMWLDLALKYEKVIAQFN